MQAPAPATPIIVKIVEENEISGLGNVMLEALGVTGVIAVGSLLFGVALAAIVIVFRKIRARLEPDDEVPQTQPLGLTPTPTRQSKV
jgi:cation transporter-like permease